MTLHCSHCGDEKGHFLRLGPGGGMLLCWKCYANITGKQVTK